MGYLKDDCVLFWIVYLKLKDSNSIYLSPVKLNLGSSEGGKWRKKLWDCNLKGSKNINIHVIHGCFLIYYPFHKQLSESLFWEKNTFFVQTPYTWTSNEVRVKREAYEGGWDKKTGHSV